MCEGHADVAYDGRVGEVALQAAYRQFLCQECKHGVGHAHVSLAVLEVDGVHLVGHGAAAHLSGLDALLEVIDGDIHPDIAVEVDDDGVDAAQGVEDGCQIVIVGNLGGVLLALQSEAVGEETVGPVGPVVLRIGHVVGIEVSRGTAELGGEGRVLQRAQLLLQAVDEDLQLFA